MDNKELRNSLIDFDMITSRVLGATDSEQLIFSQQRVDAYMKGLTGQYDMNGTPIKIGDVLSLNGETDFNTTMCGEVTKIGNVFICDYGKDLLGRKCFDELHEVAKDREVVGNIDTWEQ